VLPARGAIESTRVNVGASRARLSRSLSGIVLRKRTTLPSLPPDYE
jgi:hypothetical protein